MTSSSRADIYEKMDRNQMEVLEEEDTDLKRDQEEVEDIVVVGEDLLEDTPAEEDHM